MSTSRFSGIEDEERLGRRFLQIAPPLVVGLAYLAARSDGLRSAMRIFSGMWLHELGHAVAAWLCGFWALPGPWRTAIGEQRSVAVVVLVLAILGGVAWRARESRTALVVLGGLLLLHLTLVLALRGHSARAFVTFAGDGGQLVLGTLLVATFWAPPGSKLHRDWLRWGFLFLGAAAFMDAYVTWAQAAHDPGAIPFGDIEGVGLSDPSVLVDEHGWSVKQLVTRYRALGIGGLLVMAALYLVGLTRRS